MTSKNATSPGDNGASQNETGLGGNCSSRPKYTISLPTSQTLIMCERCGGLERVSWQEAEKRMTPCLCGQCFYTPIPTTSGGPVHWAACDALFGFERELVEAGVVRHHHPDVWRCLKRAYARMSRASYLEAADLGAFEEWGLVEEVLKDDDDG